MGLWWSGGYDEDHHYLENHSEPYRHGHHHHHEYGLPMFASIGFHSWIGWLEYFWLFIVGLLTLVMLTGFWQQGSTVAYLVLSVLTLVFTSILLWLNTRWYGPTIISRMYYRLEFREENIKILRDLPNYDKAMTRDIKFHKDQWLLMTVLWSFIFIVIFLAAFLGSNNSATPSPDFNSPPALYSQDAFDNYNRIRLLMLLGLLVCGGAMCLLFDTTPCFIHAYIVSTNRYLIDVGAIPPNGLPLKPESNAAPDDHHHHGDGNVVVVGEQSLMAGNTKTQKRLNKQPQYGAKGAIDLF